MSLSNGFPLDNNDTKNGHHSSPTNNQKCQCIVAYDEIIAFHTKTAYPSFIEKFIELDQPLNNGQNGM